MELKLNSLTKEYGTKRAVDGVTVDLTPGIYGLLGPNGAGKTTLMRMICALMKPTAGAVLFNGAEISALGERYRGLLGFLPQHFGYYRDLSVRDFLSYLAYLKGLRPSAAQESIRWALEAMGLTDAADTGLSQLSGGMRRRVGIAQALLNDPAILVLDEPTAGLDPAERVRFRNLIGSLAGGRIVILSTHIVSDISYLADQLLLLHNGRLLYQGTVAALTKQADGQVWEGVLEPSQAQRLSAQYVVSKTRHVPQGVELRLLSDAPPFEGAKSVAPDLEDAYLLYTGRKGGDEL